MKFFIEICCGLMMLFGTLSCSNCNPVQVPQGSEGVIGTVTDPAGRPVVGASVQAEATSEPRPAIPEIAIVTDRNGRYAWRLPPGEYAMTVIADGFQKSSKPARVEHGQQVILDFQLDPKL